MAGGDPAPTRSVWADAVHWSLDEALDTLATAVRDCPHDRWQTPMWEVRAAEIIGDVRDSDGRIVTDPAARAALVQRWSTPWSVAWHALEVLDYDLSGELVPWTPPSPFAEHPHWLTFTSLASAWTKPQIEVYLDHCRARVHDVLTAMTEELAATSLPAAHRYSGQPYARIVTALVGHTTAHAVQIRQFATS